MGELPGTWELTAGAAQALFPQKKKNRAGACLPAVILNYCSQAGSILPGL